ncbi:MAG TPA: DUF202 domain-containing protein [Polyangiaceae bacterium]|nr:DUF202 domain-containing protein [Polyangiaceae bacterium]
MTQPSLLGVETLRLHQANERTMLAWIRTGIALMAFGFAIARFSLFLHQVMSASPPVAHGRGMGATWVGAALVALGMLANLLATLRYGRIRKAIERGDIGAPSPVLVYVFGGLVTLVGLIMTLLLVRTLGE